MALRDCVAEPQALALALWQAERLGDEETVEVTLEDGEALGERVPEVVSLGEWLGERVAEAQEEPLLLPVRLAEAEGQGVELGELLPVPQWVEVRVAEAQGEALGLSVPLGQAEGEGEREAVSEADWVPLPVKEPDGLPEGLPVSEGV